MDDTNEQQETSTDHGTDAQRSIIRESVDEIAAKVPRAKTALRSTLVCIARFLRPLAPHLRWA